MRGASARLMSLASHGISAMARSSTSLRNRTMRMSHSCMGHRLSRRMAVKRSANSARASGGRSAMSRGPR
eukprot:5757920-Lingulodinium_polyedra.AAC.1